MSDRDIATARRIVLDDRDYLLGYWDPTMMTRRERRATASGATVRYDPETERVVVSCANRAEFHLPIEAFAPAARGTREERAAVTVSRSGDGIRWDVFDVDYYWPYLLSVLLGPAAWRRASRSALGSMTSPAKARAARANGAKGGRPRKRQAVR
jgi:hypothetical protein